MSFLPAITGVQLIKALRRLGFDVVRSKGNHHFLRHADDRASVVPVHHGETIGRGLLSQIMHDCEISKETLKRNL